jgi:hypothetical protein
MSTASDGNGCASLTTTECGAMDGEPAGHACDAESAVVRDGAEDIERGRHGYAGSGKGQGGWDLH